MQQPELYFREDQQFRQPWLWVFLLLLSTFAMGTILFYLMQLISATESGTGPTMPFWLVVTLGLVLFLGNLAIIAAIGFARLQTEVTASGLFLRFVPFHRKVRQISLEDVQGVASMQIRPWTDYGGYGIRRSRLATAYIVCGEQGVRINYANGCHILIGTQHPDELRAAIESVLRR